MDQPTLRLADRRDLAQLVALERAAFATDRLSRRALRYSLTVATRRVLVIVSGQHLLASAVVCIRNGFVRVYSLAVDERARGLGLGAMLLDAVERMGRDLGRSSVRLEVRTDNQPALALYRRCAYVHFGDYRSYYQDGCDALRLEKRASC